MATLRMIDIAVNFTDGMFKGIYHGKQYHAADLAAVLSRAWSAGVQRIIVTGGSLEESREALKIAETDGLFCFCCLNSVELLICFQTLFLLVQPVVLLVGRLFCTVGVHPTRCKEFEESGDPETYFQALLSLTKEGIEKGKVVAVGECGLDYDRLHFCPADIQKKYFEKQFELAHTTKLPMFLHMRAAAEDFCDIVERNKQRFCAGVVHSFTDSAEDRDKLLSFSNLYIGINGCSLKTAENLDVVRGIPIERLMIETDSPYCEIKNTHAGIKLVKSVWASKKKEKHDEQCIVKGRNEPCLVRQVLEVLAGCKGIMDINQLSETLYHNTCRVFFPQDLDSAADALLAGSRDLEEKI
ncbi:putative deoxyribonuclease TATDN1 isoform X1 [Cucumis sativus]|uniref:putative deoxyribonuclease TATDN1 isoform X1 n=1 Tax=Cucumis sativus TaxID=3659 RepID=UPI0012F4A988|nr:putative deoxyribonuclease TATDN1 isoform X1 [Cucumis sativus]